MTLRNKSKIFGAALRHCGTRSQTTISLDCKRYLIRTFKGSLSKLRYVPLFSLYWLILKDSDRILQRTAIRLCVLRAIKPFKRFAALESVVKILREEIVALEDATASLNVCCLRDTRDTCPGA